MSLTKWITVLSAIFLTACQGHGSNDNGGGGGGAGPAPKAKVNMKGSVWEVQSVLAVSQAGRVTVYFLQEPGIACANMWKLSEAKTFVTITMPYQSANYDFKNSTDMARESVTGSFSESTMSATAFDTMKAAVTTGGATLALDLQAATNSGHDISGVFKTPVCEY